MHIPDGWIDLPTSAVAAGAAATAVTVSARRATAHLKHGVTATPAVVAAYLLVAQLLVVPIGLGTGAHLIGTGLAAVLIGPALAIVCVAVVVIIQALVLADGGVTAIGLNVLNNGVVPALVASAVFAAGCSVAGCTVANRTVAGSPVASRPVASRPVAGSPRAGSPPGGRTRRSLPVIAGVAAGLATLASGAAAALEFTVGGTSVVPARAVATALGAGHLVVALVEGVLTGLVVRVIDRLRPDLIRSPRADRTAARAVRP